MLHKIVLLFQMEMQAKNDLIRLGWKVVGFRANSRIDGERCAVHKSAHRRMRQEALSVRMTAFEAVFPWPSRSV